MSSHLSDRASQNLQHNRLREVRAWCYYNQYDPITNPNGVVAMAIAENKLMRDEVTKHINDHFRITPWVCCWLFVLRFNKSFACSSRDLTEKLMS